MDETIEEKGLRIAEAFELLAAYFYTLGVEASVRSSSRALQYYFKVNGSGTFRCNCKGYSTE